MILQFDLEKLYAPVPPVTNDIFSVSAQFIYGNPSIESGKTDLDFSEDIDRVGGFDSESIDRDTLNIILTF